MSPPVLQPAAALCKRELVRFVRQRSRVIGSLATPLIFWLFIGGGMGRSFNATGMPGGDNFLHYFFPGTVLMILLFTAIFSTISIIEDRKEGFLQSVLVSPISTMAIVLGKVMGGTILAVGQGLIFLALAPLIGIQFTLVGFLGAAVIMFVIAFALTGLGFCIAWRMSSTQGFHAIMNLFLMPMWFLSGALFPAEQAWGALRWLMNANPLSYGLSGLREVLYAPSAGAGALQSGWWTGMIVSCLFGVAMFTLASRMTRARVSGDLH
ncbi:MAG TPA: ABC transporter permease [Tepidisphaeraceae bacterium]|nr:ABC transporter permease [Tepidisphaeraceae bacterium]